MTEETAKKIKLDFGEKFSKEVELRGLKPDCSNFELYEVLYSMIPPFAKEKNIDLFSFCMGGNEVAYILFSKNDESSFGLLIELSEMSEQYDCRIITSIAKPDELNMMLSAFGYKG